MGAGVLAVNEQPQITCTAFYGTKLLKAEALVTIIYDPTLVITSRGSDPQALRQGAMIGALVGAAVAGVVSRG